MCHENGEIVGKGFGNTRVDKGGIHFRIVPVIFIYV